MIEFADGLGWGSVQGILLLSGIVLMTNIFGLKRAGRAVNAGKDLVLVRKAIEMLRSLRYE